MLTPKRAKIIILVTRLWMYEGTTLGRTRSSSRMTIAGSHVLAMDATVRRSAGTGGAATALRISRPKKRSAGRAAIRRPSFR